MPADEQGAIVESGFGQGEDEYVWVTALVENKSDRVGQTVTVSFNIKDDSGEVVSTTEQVESFSSPGQMLAVGTQADLDPGVRAASVEATLLVEDENTFEGGDDLGTAKAEYKEGEYGESEARYTVKNPTDKPVKDPRIGVICKDKDGKVNGGGSDFPTLVPPNGEIKLATYVIVSGAPEGCTAYVAPGF
ncbi:MAG: hypothetical protein EOO67_00855 [Microbacterium sp.]|nr:MAG: hypothetical protein EOO67_00855 [Microbacterium sp.]